MNYAPIALFAYKRADKLKLCIEALSKNKYADKTDVYIFSDGYKGDQDKAQVEEVRDYIKSILEKNEFAQVEVIKRDKNWGLANSIINGVTQIINQYGKIIVVEDDLITSPDFLSYMNEGLDFYKDLKQFGSISAHTYPIKALEKYNKDIYVTGKGECWGWGTWKDRWENVDWSVSDFVEYFAVKKMRKQFDSLEKGLDNMLVQQMNGKLDSWAVRWCYHLFKKGLLTVYPRVSKTKNIGFDGSGTHCGDTQTMASALEIQGNCQFEVLEVDKKIARECALYMYKQSLRDLWKRMLSRNHK